ncbi:citramalate synthase [Anaeropeptidivorans aminofermentans]|uniref:citramalate synthase n=1 Tax=Anaeropeptidivorans aminofermentans TaxID=2934315 RepID=UPI00202596B7|nr:citramalate synthase [Anaeropeptidivorans aminofermentans]
MNKKIILFDSTLRDGAQAEGISFSVEDKLKIVKALDEIGIDYIEAGNPGSNPKDLAFFKKVKQLNLKNAKIIAFGSTRRKNTTPLDDENVLSLIEANTEAVAIFGKTWDFHVTDIIKTELEENLNMIYDTVSFFTDKEKEVIFDAEHFFDGYKNNKEYAISCLKAARGGGAKCLVLCDTNGGTMPMEIYEITSAVKEELRTDIGIHCHNDCGMAVANSIMAVSAGAIHIQGTFTGFGERCGNANLSTVMANLQLKMGYPVISPDQMQHLSRTARLVSDVSNVILYEREPYVGKAAFAHKGGMHIDGVSKNSRSFEHIEPNLVGNERKLLTSEVSGRSTILKKIQKIDPSLEKDSEKTKEIMDRLKELEHQGYQFEAAESAFELVIRKSLGKYKPLFELVNFKTICERPLAPSCSSACAIINVIVDGKKEITAAQGVGPVDALDKALRKALEVFYPQLKDVHLTDYKVRVLDGKSAAESKVRVLIESTDGSSSWTTVGVSDDIIEASWIALVDSIEYKLIKDFEEKFKVYL